MAHLNLTPDASHLCDPSLVQHQSDSMLLNVEDIDPVLVRKYQSLCGALLYYAVNTRPDVAYAIGMLCRSMARPTPELYEDALRVLYYLHYTADLGLRPYATKLMSATPAA